MKNFLEEIECQDETLREMARRYADGYAPLEKFREMAKQYNRFVFVGMGSSLFASQAACTFLQRRGVCAQASEANEFLKTQLSTVDQDTLLVAVSQSGASKEVIELCKAYPYPQNIVTVVNNAPQPLGALGALCLEIFAGPEFTTANKTYTNTLGVLLYMANVICCPQESLAPVTEKMLVAAAQMRAYINDAALVARLSDFFYNAPYICFVGSAHSFSSACQGQIITEEAGKKFSACYTTAEFLHGPIELIYHDFYVFLFDNDPVFSSECDRVISSLVDFGGKICVMTNRPLEPQENLLVIQSKIDDPVFAPLTEILPLELATYEMGTRRNINPGIIVRVKK